MRPYDASIQVRVHRTTLATLALFYHNSGRVIPSVSALTRTALEDFAEALILQNHVEKVEDGMEASKILDLLQMKSGTRTTKQLLTNLQLDSFKHEKITPTFKGGRLVGGQLPIYDDEDSQLDVIRTIPDNLVVEDTANGKSNTESEGTEGEDS